MEISTRSGVMPEIKEMIEFLKQEEVVVENNNDYVKPHFASLTQEEIDDIHRRGYITQEEACKEWEEMGLCVPGNAGVNPRCIKFNNNCYDCSIDYSLSRKEHTSLISMPSIISSAEIEEFIDALNNLDEGREKVKKIKIN